LAAACQQEANLMSLVYLSPHLNSESTGGTQVAKANLQLLKLLFGDRVQAYAASRSPMPGVYPLSTSKSTAGTAWANFQGLCGTLTPKGRREFLEDISKLNPDLIWLDSSLFGGLISAIRMNVPNAKVITFFHNAEIDLVSQRIKKGAFHYIPAWIATYLNELSSAKRSDAVVCISTIDCERICQLFGRFDAQTHPVCLQKKGKNNFHWANTSEVLFVGSEFGPNIEAVNFLNEHVAPILRSKRILVAGRGLEKHLSAPRHRNIEFLGFVDDLSVFYRRSRATLAPIFSGGGMKVKIAESLMYGRPVISTNFAAIGYEKARKDSIFLANTAQDFANAIETWAPSDLESPERDFDEYYSFEAGLRSLSKIISTV
jgi:glycosyltransferase involved in cell wall biosynthesis